MAEDAINTASVVAGLKEVKCSTTTKTLGFKENIDFNHPLHAHGSDADEISNIGTKKIMIHYLINFTLVEI